MDNKECVGNIRIKESKNKKTKKKKKSDTGIIKKIFIWLMAIAMLASFLGPVIYLLVEKISEN